MTVRWRIFVFEIVTLAFVALMVGVTALSLRVADDFVRRIDGVHHRFEVIAELDGHANNYAEQIAEVLLLGPEQMPDFEAARRKMEEAFERLARVTRAEVLTLEGIEEVRREISDVEMTSRMNELYRAIDRAAEHVFALQRDGKQAEAVAHFRREVEYRLSNDFETLLENALKDERGEVASELAEVRRRQQWLLIGAIALTLLAVLFSAGFGLMLKRSIVRPVQDLAQGARAIADGALDARIPVRGRDEFAALARTFNDMAHAIEAQRGELVTAQQRLHSEVEARTAELRHANERLRDVDARRAQFLADVSHELRTPLTILRGEADVALRGRGDPGDQAEALFRIQEQAESLGSLLDDLLAFARSDAEDQSFEITLTRGRDVAAAAAAEGEALAAPRDILIETAWNDGGGVIAVDARRLKQVFLIGLDNAIKHSPAGGRVRVAALVADGRFVVEVSDEGPGLSEEDRAHVFSRFYRGRTADRGSTGGLGIGLAIAKLIVERHDGVITLDNRPSGGAVLTVSLPLAEATT